MKILHLLKTDRFSGAENVVCQIISMFSDDKEHEMVYCSVDGPIRQSLESRGIPFLPLSSFNLSEVRQAISKFDPDIIHAHDVHASLYAALSGKHRRIIDQIHGNDIGMRKTNAKSLSFRYAASKAEKIIWVYETALDDYVFSDNKKLREKSLIMKNVVDRDELYRKADSARTDECPTVVFLGRINDIKDPLRAIRIIAKVIDHLPNVTANLIGSGDLAGECESLINSLGMTDKIKLLGFMDNPYGVLSKGKVFLMTSRFEGIPMAAIEAMAFGLPIVSTPVDGMKLLVTEGKNGFVNNDDSVLVDDIVRLCEDSDLYSAMSKASLERFSELNNLDAYRRTLLEIYDGIK